MGFRNKAFATCWSVEPGKGNFTKVRLSVSKKDKATGEYVQDFSGYCMFIGTAHAKAAKLREKDRIRLLDVDVSTTYDKEAKKEYVNYKVFDFDMGDTADKPQHTADSNPVEGEEESPF